MKKLTILRGITGATLQNVEKVVEENSAYWRIYIVNWIDLSMWLPWENEYH